MVMPAQYKKDGFERREIMHMTSWEKESGSVHEASNYTAGNEVMPTRDEYKPDPKIKDELCRDMAAAIASGAWTGMDRLQDSV